MMASDLAALTKALQERQLDIVRIAGETGTLGWYSG